MEEWGRKIGNKESNEVMYLDGHLELVEVSLNWELWEPDLRDLPLQWAAAGVGWRKPHSLPKDCWGRAAITPHVMAARLACKVSSGDARISQANGNMLTIGWQAV